MNLSNDVWIIIFKKLHYIDIFNCELICRKFYNIINPYIWKKLFFNEHQIIYKRKKINNKFRGEVTLYFNYNGNNNISLHDFDTNKIIYLDQLNNIPYDRIKDDFIIFKISPEINKYPWKLIETFGGINKIYKLPTLILNSDDSFNKNEIIYPVMKSTRKYGYPMFIINTITPTIISPQYKDCHENFYNWDLQIGTCFEIKKNEEIFISNEIWDHIKIIILNLYKNI